MSKKYDEFLKNNLLKSTKILGFDKVIPMIPERDPELERELRDRAIISVVTMALKKGKELSYGEIPERDSELERDLRDRAIISAVTMALKKGKELSYGEIRLLVDDDLSELEYEGRINLNSKKNNK